MKNYLKRKSVKNYLLVILLLFAFDNGIAQEDVLDLDITEVSEVDADDFIDKGLNYISLSSGTIEPYIYTINQESVAFLKGKATEQYIPGTSCPNYITGVKISLGIDQGNPRKMQLLFQPIYMCRISGTTNATFQITWVSPVTYTLDKSVSSGNQMQETTDETCIDNYQEELRIDRYFWPFDRNFRYNMDATGDARSLIYPIQELEKTMETNQMEGLGLFSIGFRHQPYGSVTYTKHSLMLGPSLNKGPKSLNIYSVEQHLFKKFKASKHYADKANLCPPDCDRVFYKVQSTK